MKTLFNYSVEFRRNLGIGYGKYTWFVSRPNYSRKALPMWTSDTVWVYSTDHASEFDLISNMDIESAIRYIKRFATDKYNVNY